MRCTLNIPFCGPARKSQASMEFIMTVGFALLMIIPLVVILYEQTFLNEKQIYSNQAGLIVRKLTDNADSVFYLGAPATTVLSVYMPNNVKNISLIGKELVFTMADGSDIVSLAVVNLTGNISVGSGPRQIRLTAMPYAVNISDDSS